MDAYTSLVLLVAMSGSGAIEGYSAASGEWLGTFALGVDHPNGLAVGPDGHLYVSTGRVHGPGSVLRYDLATGRPRGSVVDGLARGNGMAFAGDDLLVVSCDDGRIVRVPAGAGPPSTMADVTPVSVTQIAVRKDRLYAADFQSGAILSLDLDAPSVPSAVTAIPGFRPWGLVFRPSGHALWSGQDGTIRQFDGDGNHVWVGPEAGLATPVWLEIGPDGRLYCANHGANSVDVFTGVDEPSGTRVLRISGPEVQRPIGLTFMEGPMPTVEFTEIRSPRKSAASICLEAMVDQPVVSHLGWDTEKGDRAKNNLLRSPLVVEVMLGEATRSLSGLEVECQSLGRDHITYHARLTDGAGLVYEVRANLDGLALRFVTDGPGHCPVTGLRLVVPLDPTMAATTVLSAEHDESGVFALPAIVSAPDQGQMLLACPSAPGVRGHLVGDRPGQWVDIEIDLPAPGRDGIALELSPVALPMPDGISDAKRWRQARRGWYNMLQVNAQPEGAGVWANNVISNPVSSTAFWLADHILLQPDAAPGVPLAPLLRRTVEYWLGERTNDEGLVRYVEWEPMGPYVIDSNPSVLIGAWAYVEVSQDDAWLREHIDRLEFVASYLEGRDIDGDGLIESVCSGNRGTHTFGDTGWDTYSSGHKNTYVNALCYRAFCGLAELERRLDRHEQGLDYDRRASAIKGAFRSTFYNPETGWLGWWRSEDGFLHDVYSDVPTSMAIVYELIDPDDGRVMLDAYWAELQSTGFDRYDLGIPLNARPVHRDDQYGDHGGSKADGSDTFGKYLNGGCCVSNTSWFLVANYIVGRRERADRILDAMLDRQHRGVFANGGGFQNGVINRMPDGAEFFDWDGTTCGYEGHLVYSWMFLQSVLLRHPQYRERLYRPLG